MNLTDFLSVFFIAVSLSFDCFAVALGGGTASQDRSWFRIFRVAFFFGLFQAVMPLLGWLAGRTVVDYIADFDHWIAFVLLAAVGGKMFWEAFHGGSEREKTADISRGLLLIALSIATSIDALAVGLTFAFIKVDIAVASPVIGIVAFVATILGFLMGRKAGKLIGKRAEILGGVILLAIAFRILISHLIG